MDDANLEEGEKTRLVLGVEISFNTTSKVLLANLTSLREGGREGGRERMREREREREREKKKKKKVTRNEPQSTVRCHYDRHTCKNEILQKGLTSKKTPMIVISTMNI